jgi:hypothetical protein
MFAFPTDEASAFWQQAPANFECVSHCVTSCRRLIPRNIDQRTGVSSSKTWPQCPHMTRRVAGLAVDPQFSIGLDVQTRFDARSVNPAISASPLELETACDMGQLTALFPKGLEEPVGN